MKHKLLGLALLLPFAALAADTVTFYGEVSDSTCNVTVNGTNGEVSVQLPTVQTLALNTAAKVAGNTPFTFTLSGCSAVDTPKTTTVGMRLLSNSAANSGNLLNIASAAKADNVSIQILDNATTGSPITVDFSKGEYKTAMKTIPAGATTAEFPFSAQYYATGAAGVGKVQAQLQYALTYQ